MDSSKPITSFIEKHYLHFNAAALVDAAKGYKAHKAAGKKMLVSLAGAMSTAELGKIYPGLLNDVRTGLRNVGLTDISSDIAASAVLGSIQTTKEN